MIKQLSAMVFSLILLTPIAQAQQKELRSIQFNVFREDPVTVIARLKGFFAAESLEVKVSRTANSTDQMRGLSDGTYKIASTPFDNVLGWSGRDGAELIAVAQLRDKAIFQVFARPEIKQWSDLRGKKLAVDSADTAFALVLRKILLAKGLDLTRADYELVPVGGTPLRLESMKKGDTVAGILGPPVDTQSKAAGMIRLGDSSEVLPDFPNTIFAVNRAWAQSQGQSLVGFLRARFASQSWIKVNRDEAIKLAAGELKVNPKTVAKLLDEVSPTGALNLKGLKNALDLRNEFRLTPPMGSDIAKYFDTQYYQAAVGR